MPAPSSPAPQDSSTVEYRATPFFRSEDWLAMMVGAILLAVSLLVLAWGRPSADIVTEKVTKWNSLSQSIKEVARIRLGRKNNSNRSLTSERSWKGDSSEWTETLDREAQSMASEPNRSLHKQERDDLSRLARHHDRAFYRFRRSRVHIGQNPIRFALAFVVIFLLAIIASRRRRHKLMDKYNLEYALWALFVGLFISNTIGTPKFLQPALRTELYIKTGLVLLGQKYCSIACWPWDSPASSALGSLPRSC